MKKRCLHQYAACLLFGLLLTCEAAPAWPEFQKMTKQLRPDHPRIFLTEEMLPEVRNYARTVQNAELDALRRRVAAYPEHPRLEIWEDVAELVNGKVVFKKKISDQNNVSFALRYTGGPEAMDCALLYRLEGDLAAARRGIDFLRVMVQFVQLADRSRILPDWYNYNRVSAFAAYDWLYEKMTPQERRDFILPMLRHLEHIQNPGYHHNGGTPREGNYGDAALQWYAGLAAYGDGIDDEAARRLLKAGYELHARMMDFREEASGGKGLLLSICTQYCFQAYPLTGFNFLHSLRSATGIDGTAFWKQPCDYPHFVDWMMIPSTTTQSTFHDFGWGDTPHITNELLCGKLYSHMAQTLHFYGELLAARTVMARLPKKLRDINAQPNLPYLPFLLTRFRPAEPEQSAPPDSALAEFFPSYGLMTVRSGRSVDDTFASCKTGAQYDSHQHYDENSFVIFKKGFLALDTGMRGSELHHRAYYPQSVAHNTILIRVPGEPLPKYWYPQNGPAFPKDLENDGGQIRKAAARHLGFQKTPWFAVTAGDAAACYGPKCREATRFFVYVKPDYFIIYDRVESADPDAGKFFLLHTQNRPEPQNGVWRAAAGGGALFLRTLLPAKPVTDVIGGPGREFVAGGVNYPVNPRLARNIGNRHWLGRYRLEITTADARAGNRFLHLLQAADAAEPRMVPVRLLQSKSADGVAFTTREKIDCEIHFQRRGTPGGTISLRRNGTLLWNGPLLPQPK